MTNLVDVFHPSIYIAEELSARGWSLDRLAREMGGDFGVNRLALDLYFSQIASDKARLGEIAEHLAVAFGTSAAVWRNLETAYLAHWHTDLR